MVEEGVLDVFFEVGLHVTAATLVMLVEVFGGGLVVEAELLFEIGEADGFRRDEADVGAAWKFRSDDFGAAADDDAASEAGELEDGVAGVVENGPHGGVESE